MQNGTVIEGNFFNDEFMGDARITYGNGDVYFGGFDNGEKNGYGELVTQNLEYKGHFLNNTFHGVGQMLDRITRQIISGDFFGGKPHGQVSITDLDGNPVYTGEVDKGIRQGAGKAEGDYWSYNGSWSAGEWNGQGTLKLKDKPWVYEGSFKMGVREVIPNKVLFSVFREEWIDPEQAVADSKKDDKSKKPQTLQKDPSKDLANAKKGSTSPPIPSSTTNSKANLLSEDQIAQQKKLLRQVELIPSGEAKINLSNKEALNLLIKVVYQGPDYPDPNPPPPDPKKRAPARKGAKDAPEEPEIPMLTPPPVVLAEESNRLFKVELHQLNEDGTLGQSFKIDYRSELSEIEELIKEKENLDQKMKDIKAETPTSRNNIVVKKAAPSKTEDYNLNIYTPEVHESEKPLIVSTVQGFIEIMGLKYPENFPGGNFRFTITDLSPRTLRFVENLGKKTLDVTFIAKDQADPSLAKKKGGPVPAKKK